MDLYKVIAPGAIKIGNRLAPIFCKIEHKDGRLSITGVEGPLRNGDAIGSCGQIDMSLKDCVQDITPADGWTHDTIRQFFEVWGRWHLNAMRAECVHQRAAGWPETAKREVTLYHFRLTDAANREKEAAENAALEALRRGEHFQPSDLQQTMAQLPYALVHHEPHLPARGQFYEPKRSIYQGDQGPEERKLLGWLRPSEHPDGLLFRPCPECGYKYGSAWLREDVPADILQWLAGLPDSPVKPAWV